jgi:protein-S-isoprenylcysteine O-methyltransferase Ste14
VDGERIKPELRWTLGCLVGTAALVGVVILALLVTLALQPPEWVQVLTGVALVGGGALLAWLVASALGRSRARRQDR